jgi:hypothetical protein
MGRNIVISVSNFIASKVLLIVHLIGGEGVRPRKLRDKANKHDVFGLGDGEKIIVKCDETYKPYTQAGSLLASWLGLVAKDGKLAPLNIPAWDNPAFRQYQVDMLQYIEVRSILVLSSGLYLYLIISFCIFVLMFVGEVHVP